MLIELLLVGFQLLDLVLTVFVLGAARLVQEVEGVLADSEDGIDAVRTF